MNDDHISVEPLLNQSSLGEGENKKLSVILADADGNPIDVILGNDGTYQLAVSQKGHVCTDNSTSEILLADAVFNGDWQDTLDYGSVFVGVKSDVVSATDGLVIQWSADGSTVHDTDVFTIAANSGKIFTFGAARRYVKIVYTNGGGDQGSFNLETRLLKLASKYSSHRIQDSIVNEDDAELVKSVLSGESDITGIFENIKTYRNALQVDNSLVHRIGISEHVKINVVGLTTTDVEASSGDTLINVAATTNFIVGTILTINGTSLHERSHFHVTAVNAGVSLTLDRPLDNDHPIGAVVQAVDIAMNVAGTLASPLSYKAQPSSNERWQLTRIMITLLDQTVMDDAKFGGITALINGVIIRLNINGSVQTLTHWKSNGDLKDDMYDVIYSLKAPAGFYGLSGRWTFTKAEFVADLDGANGDYLEVLIQDNLTELDDFEVKCQGRLFGG